MWRSKTCGIMPPRNMFHNSMYAFIERWQFGRISTKHVYVCVSPIIPCVFIHVVMPSVRNGNINIYENERKDVPFIGGPNYGLRLWIFTVCIYSALCDPYWQRPQSELVTQQRLTNEHFQNCSDSKTSAAECGKSTHGVHVFLWPCRTGCMTASPPCPSETTQLSRPPVTAALPTGQHAATSVANSEPTTRFSPPALDPTSSTASWTHSVRSPTTLGFVAPYVVKICACEQVGKQLKHFFALRVSTRFLLFICKVLIKIK